MSDHTVGEVRRVLSEHSRMTANAEKLGLDESLYDAGMTSHAGVNVMLALEDAFDIEFPDRMLTRNVFETIRGISEALDELVMEEAR